MGRGKCDIPHCTNCTSFKKSLFSCLSDKNISFLESSLIHRSYKKGQTIFYKGDQPKGLYCVHSGRIKLIRFGLNDHSVIVRFVVSGDLLGYRSLFSKEPYSASAKVVEDAAVCFIPKTYIDMLINRDENLPQALLSKMSRDLRDSEDRLLSFVDASLRERLAEFLIALKEQYGVIIRDGKEFINFKLSRREMACFLGTTTESVIRQISQFKKEDLIKEELEGISINEDQLHSIAYLN